MKLMLTKRVIILILSMSFLGKVHASHSTANVVLSSVAGFVSGAATPVISQLTYEYYNQKVAACVFYGASLLLREFLQPVDNDTSQIFSLIRSKILPDFMQKIGTRYDYFFPHYDLGLAFGTLYPAYLVCKEDSKSPSPSQTTSE
jgi:hypothetical protein